MRVSTKEGYRAAFESVRDEYARHHYIESIAGVECLFIEPEESGQAATEGVLLYFFGGGYIQGSPEEDLVISAPLAALTGLRVIAPYYRLSPEYSFEAKLEDAGRVYRALAETDGSGPLALVGESAGGNLALHTMLLARRLGLVLPEACALLSPWADLTNSGDSVSFNDGRDPSLSRAYLDNATALIFGDREVEDEHLSPLQADEFGAGFPPTLITSGTRDLLLSQCALVAQRIRQAGTWAELRVWEEMWHVFEFYPNVPEALESLREIAGFLRLQLSASAATRK